MNETWECNIEALINKVIRIEARTKVILKYSTNKNTLRQIKSITSNELIKTRQGRLLKKRKELFILIIAINAKEKTTIKTSSKNKF